MPTDGLLHIQSASAGVVAASTNADELVIEGQTAIGISLLVNSGALEFIAFGDVGSAIQAFYGSWGKVEQQAQSAVQ